MQFNTEADDAGLRAFIVQDELYNSGLRWKEFKVEVHLRALQPKEAFCYLLHNTLVVHSIV